MRPLLEDVCGSPYMIEVLMGAEHKGRYKSLLRDKVTKLLFLRVAHAAWVNDGCLTALFIIEDVGILLYRPEGKLVNLKHRLIMMIVLVGDSAISL